MDLRPAELADRLMHEFLALLGQAHLLRSSVIGLQKNDAGGFQAPQGRVDRLFGHTGEFVHVADGTALPVVIEKMENQRDIVGDSEPCRGIVIQCADHHRQQIELSEIVVLTLTHAITSMYEIVLLV